MKKILTIILVALCFQATAQNIPPRPNPPKLVNDLAGVMTHDQVETLERKLYTYDDSTSNQIVVVTIKSTGEYDIQDVALKILRDWGVGNKEKNNGIVLLAAIDDRKIWIATGYGLEGAIPDITAKHIIENEIVPNFKQSNYYRGFDEATSAIIKAAAGEYKAEAGYNKRRGGKGIPPFAIFIGIFVILAIISAINKRGGGGGGMMSRRGYRGWDNPIWWFPTGGGSSSGGSSWGGGGGGFGGFGGGSGGGGGAGGSW